jgi:hypothetical protein
MTSLQSRIRRAALRPCRDCGREPGDDTSAIDAERWAAVKWIDAMLGEAIRATVAAAKSIPAAHSKFRDYLFDTFGKARRATINWQRSCKAPDHTCANIDQEEWLRIMKTSWAKPIEVVEQLEFGQPQSMTGFPPRERAIFPGNPGFLWPLRPKVAH